MRALLKSRHLAETQLVKDLAGLLITEGIVHAALEHRAAVPGSLGRDIGLVPATGVVLSMAWGVPALLAVVLGRLARTGVERGTPAVAAGPASATIAAALAGVAALAAAIVLTR